MRLMSLEFSIVQIKELLDTYINQKNQITQNYYKEYLNQINKWPQIKQNKVGYTKQRKQKSNINKE